jgi:hypothetical protein
MDGKSVSNGKTETVTGFSNAEEEKVSKLEVGGCHNTAGIVWVTSSYAEKSGRHGAPVRITAFFGTSNLVAVNVRTFTGEELCAHGHGG